MKKNLLLFAVLGVALVAVLASELLYQRPAAPDPEPSPVVRATDGLARMHSSTAVDGGVTPLSKWEFIAHDTLASTYVTGYTLENSSPGTLEVTFPRSLSRVPLPFFVQDTLMRPIRDVRYEIEADGIVRASVPFERAGDVVFLDQVTLYPEQKPFIEVPDIRVAGAVVGEPLAVSVTMPVSESIVPAAAIDARERGLLLDPAASRISVTVEPINDRAGPAVTRQLLYSSVIPNPVALSDLTTSEVRCVESGVARVQVTVEVRLTTSSFERTVTDWIQHRLRQSNGWNLIQSSVDESRFTFTDTQRVVCQAKDPSA
jgi:hypothetical protein